jgi:hypothetical protein
MNAQHTPWKREAKHALIPLPSTFYDDHAERALPTPELIRRAGSRVWVRRNDKALPELLADAEYYAHMYGPDEAPPAVTASARRTVATLRQYNYEARAAIAKAGAA